MTKSFRFSSSKHFIVLFLLCLITTSCSKNTYPLTTGNQAIIKTGDKAERFNFKIKFGSKQFDAMMIARQMNTDEVRILATTPFGLSLFDFGLTKDSLIVYSCIEPMQKKQVLKILETDFKLLFLPNRTVNKIEKKNSYIKYVSGKGITKGVMRVNKSDTDKIKIKHSWIRLNIELEKMQEAKTDE